MKQFGIGVLFGFLGLVFGLAAIGTAVAVFTPDRMPAPALTKLVQLDEKLRFLRERPNLDPTILAVGSSVTWRQLDGRQFSSVAGGDGRFFNGGTGYLQIHQTRDLVHFYLHNFGNVRVLLLMINLPDFRDCSNEPPDMLSHKESARYAFEHWPSPYFYFRYLSPKRYLRTAMVRPDQLGAYEGDMFLDPYGSSPLEVPEQKLPGLRYGDITQDDACFAALNGLLGDAASRGIFTFVIAPPVHPDYRAKFPKELSWLQEKLERLKAARRDGRDGFEVRDLTQSSEFGVADFYDAFHLQWHAVPTLSRDISAMIADAVAPDGEVPAAAPVTRRTSSGPIGFAIDTGRGGPGRRN